MIHMNMTLTLDMFMSSASVSLCTCVSVSFTFLKECSQLKSDAPEMTHETVETDHLNQSVPGHDQGHDGSTQPTSDQDLQHDEQHDSLDEFKQKVTDAFAFALEHGLDEVYCAEPGPTHSSTDQASSSAQSSHTRDDGVSTLASSSTATACKTTMDTPCTVQDHHVPKSSTKRSSTLDDGRETSDKMQKQSEPEEGQDKSETPFVDIPEFGENAFSSLPFTSGLDDDKDDTGPMPSNAASQTATSENTMNPDAIERERRESGSQVNNMFEAMQWPSYHTSQLLDHMKKDTDKSRRVASDASDSEVESDTEDTNRVESQLHVPGLKTMFALFDSVPVSTAFSGIDAPGTGLSQQVAQLNHQIKERNRQRAESGSAKRERLLGEPIHLNAIEWFAPSKKELRYHPSPPLCLFSDITDFLHQSLKLMLPELHAKGKMQEVLGQTLRHANSLRMFCP